MLSMVNYIGRKTIGMSGGLGAYAIFIYQTLFTTFTSKPSVKKILYYAERIGVNSITIVVLTGFFTGAVLALQSYEGFKRFGGTEFIGPVVALGMIRELGPVLTGLMVTGRAGSAIAAEIGTMQITEQIDALRTLRISPLRYLVIPRIISGTLILPFLALFSMLLGIFGGYVVYAKILNLNPEQYISSIKAYVELRDIQGGLLKSSVFGFILSSIGCYKGYTTEGGARGVGISTTQSVVISSITILISNYFLTKFLES